jgi:hypothetical protein
LPKFFPTNSKQGNMGGSVIEYDNKGPQFNEDAFVDPLGLQ